MVTGAPSASPTVGSSSTTGERPQEDDPRVALGVRIPRSLDDRPAVLGVQLRVRGLKVTKCGVGGVRSEAAPREHHRRVRCLRQALQRPATARANLRGSICLWRGGSARNGSRARVHWGSGQGGESSIHLAPVGHSDDQYQQLIVPGLVDDPVVTGTIDPDPPPTLLPDQRPTSRRAGVALEMFKLGEYPSSDLSIQLVELASCRGHECDSIA